MDCGHIYVPKRRTWGSTSSPPIGDVVMSLFFTLGSTVHDWGWPKNGPFWTKNGQTWQACQRSKVVQRGPKGTKMVNLSLFDHLGPRLGPSGPFWTISDKNDFFAPNGQNRVLQRCFGAKYQFLFKMVQKGRRTGPSDSFQILCSFHFQYVIIRLQMCGLQVLKQEAWIRFQQQQL